MKGMKKGEWYTSNDCKHNRNQTAYAFKGRKFVLQMTNGLVGERHKKLVQFATMFHTLKHGLLMLEYEVQKDLFVFFIFEESPKMHWTNNYGRVIAQHMHGIILEATQFAIGATQYSSLICDEVSTIDNQSRLLVHVYVVQNWLKLQILLSLECVVARSSVDNLTLILIQALMHQRGLTKKLNGNRFMTFGVDGVFVFQGTKLGVTQQIFDGWVSYFMGVHYVAHRTNLGVQIVSHLQMVNRFEGLFQNLYNYFSKSPKRHVEFTKLAKLMEPKGVKILKNVKTH